MSELNSQTIANLLEATPHVKGVIRDLCRLIIMTTKGIFVADVFSNKVEVGFLTYRGIAMPECLSPQNETLSSNEEAVQMFLDWHEEDPIVPF